MRFLFQGGFLDGAELHTPAEVVEQAVTGIVCFDRSGYLAVSANDDGSVNMTPCDNVLRVLSQTMQGVNDGNDAELTF